MRKLRGQLMEMVYLLKYIWSERISRTQLFLTIILLIAGLGTLSIGLIWVFS